MLFMYQNESFFLNDENTFKIFQPKVTSAFKILADGSYFHYCDEEEKLRHPSQTIAFIRCTDGCGKIRIKDNKISIKKNECVFLKFHDIEEYKSLSNIWAYRWVNFTAEHICTEFEFNKIYSIPFGENEDKTFNRMLAYGQINQNNKSYLSSLFLNYFYSVMLENKFDFDELIPNSGKKLIDEMCSYINQKLYSKISIEEVSVFFRISPRRLHQIFTNELGISPKQYIIKKKMEEGYRLLVQTSSPINKIAYMLCFSSPYHFTNEFKKIFGQTPSEVRKMENRQ